jgi:hypothetical protein
MAIVFDCPFCKLNYRLKDDFAGKIVTCKSPNCRKNFKVPAPKGLAAPSAPVDVDALAAAAFSDEPVKAQTVEEMIPVTCAGCDHVWQVEASKEGKNVLCPECRKVNSVPIRKKAEKVDWRTGADGRPTLAKRETGMDVEGAFASTNIGSIGQQTAKKIVSERAAEEEPEVRRKKLLKRGAIGLIVVLLLGVGGNFACKKRTEARTEGKMEDAVKELTGPDGTKDVRFHALILRASGEFRIRKAATPDDVKAAMLELQKAKNQASNVNPNAKNAEAGADRNGILSEVAITQVELVGNAEQIEKGERMKQNDVVKEMRTTLQTIVDPDLQADTVRAMTRRLATLGQPTLAEESIRQLSNYGDLAGHIGLELMRIDRVKFLANAEDMLKKSGTGETPAPQALKLILGKVSKKGAETAAPSQIAYAEFNALKGDYAAAKTAAGNASKPEDKVKAYAAAGRIAAEAGAPEAAGLLEAAAALLKNEAKGAVSPWIVARICKHLAQAGRPEAGESLAASLTDEAARSWARLGILRGRLAQAKDTKGDDGWLESVGDPAKLPAAAKAREDLARHNARVGSGGDYQSTVKTWPKGTVRPFGIAGLILGGLDRAEK